MSALPQHKTDAIFRIFDTDRYDDRDVVITNLIESYDRLMAFGKKHLNDTFHLDGIQSVSARDHILREIVSNLLMHRDFSSGYVAKPVIEKTRLYTENANLSHGHGVLDIATFEPYQKNPPISKVFRITIPLSEVATATVGPNASDDINETRNDTGNDTEKFSQPEVRILEEILKNPYATKMQISEILDISPVSVARATKKLKGIGIIMRVGSTKSGYWKILK